MSIIVLIFLLASSSSSVSCTTRASSPSPVMPHAPSNDATIKATLLMSLLVFLFTLFLTAFCSLFIRCFSRQYHALLQTTRGLDPRVLATCPLMSYSELKLNHLNAPQTAALQCTVCLADFADADALRLLPKCGHVFHILCIDAWLASDVTCPVCRGEVSAETERETRASHVLEEGSVRVLLRSHSTGHSLECFSMKFPDEVMKKVLEDGEFRHEMMMKRSSSYDVVLGIEEASVGTINNNNNNRWVLLMTPPFVSGGSRIPRFWGGSLLRQEKECPETTFCEV